MNCCHESEANGSATLEMAKRSLIPHPKLNASPTPALASTTLIGTVVTADDAPANLTANNILIEFTTHDSLARRVSAELSQGLNANVGDRVLFVLPANAPLAVVISVLSPARERPVPEIVPLKRSIDCLRPNQELVLQDAESLCVTTTSGQTLVAIERGAKGPIIRLGQGSLELDMPGELHLMADSLRFTTRNGPISLESQTDDVVVRGRTIRLN
jgi:hypothetical protein